MMPVLALVGSPNVGKSTLFNRLTRTRNALVADYAGLTRDRIYGNVDEENCRFILIDTGGLTEQADNMAELMRKQARLAIESADLILFVVDGRAGMSAADQSIASMLRQEGKAVLLVVNKTEGEQKDVVAAEFFALGLDTPQVISATQGRGISDLLNRISSRIPSVTQQASAPDSHEDQIRLAVLGRPNVGKSTLINRLLGEERVVAFDEPGTTRDSIHIPFEKEGVQYTLIDTAGVRRRSRVSEALEKFSILKTLQALEDANVVMLILDAHEGIVDQDLHLAGLIVESGRALVIVVNKWDGLDKTEREWVASNLQRRLPFLSYAKTHFISALHGSGVGLLLKSVRLAYQAAMSKPPTSRLTRILEDAVADHPPPLVHGRRIKYRYAHLGGKNPPRIIIHGNQTEATPDSYRRYLENFFRKSLKLDGTPVMIEFKTSDNPFREQRDVSRAATVKNSAGKTRPPTRKLAAKKQR